MKMTLAVLAILCSIGLSAQNLAPDISSNAWSLWTDGPVDVKFGIDKTISGDNKACGKITVPNITEKGAAVYSYVEMKGSKNYSVSFDFKVKDFQKTETGYAKVGFSFKKKDEGNGSAGTSSVPLDVDAAQSDWQKFTNEIQAPADAVLCQLIILSGLGIKGTLWIRDVRVEEIGSFGVLVGKGRKNRNNRLKNM